MAGVFDGFKNRATVMVFRDPVTPENTKEFALDASVSLSTSLTANVTTFPVEGRQNITDHVQPQPLTIQVEAVIAESPSQKLLTLANTLANQAVTATGQFQGLSATFASAALATASSQFLRNREFEKAKGNFAALLTNRAEVDPNFPKRAMLGLQKAFDRGELFDIRTFFSDVLYKDMVMTTLTFSQTAEMGDSLSFNFTAQKITTVEDFVRVQTELRMKDPAGTSGAESTDKGEKNKLPEQKPGSIATQIVDFASGKSSAPTPPPATPQIQQQRFEVRRVRGVF